MKNLYKKIHNTHENKMETIRLGMHVSAETGNLLKLLVFVVMLLRRLNKLTTIKVVRCRKLLKSMKLPYRDWETDRKSVV